MTLMNSAQIDPSITGLRTMYFILSLHILVWQFARPTAAQENYPKYSFTVPFTAEPTFKPKEAWDGNYQNYWNYQTKYPTFKPKETWGYQIYWTRYPTRQPTEKPTSFPTKYPTKFPTKIPTEQPTTPFPTKQPTSFPTYRPTSSPTADPTDLPSLQPTTFPTTVPLNVTFSSFNLNIVTTSSKPLIENRKFAEMTRLYLEDFYREMIDLNVGFRRISFSQKCVEKKEKRTTGAADFFVCTFEKGDAWVDSTRSIPSKMSLDNLNEYAFSGEKRLNYLSYLQSSDDLSEILSITFSEYLKDGEGRNSHSASFSKENGATKQSMMNWLATTSLLITMGLIGYCLIYCFRLNTDLDTPLGVKINKEREEAEKPVDLELVGFRDDVSSLNYGNDEDTLDRVMVREVGKEEGENSEENGEDDDVETGDGLAAIKTNYDTESVETIKTHESGSEKNSHSASFSKENGATKQSMMNWLLTTFLLITMGSIGCCLIYCFRLNTDLNIPLRVMIYKEKEEAEKSVDLELVGCRDDISSYKYGNDEDTLNKVIMKGCGKEDGENSEEKGEDDDIETGDGLETIKTNDNSKEKGEDDDVETEDSLDVTGRSADEDDGKQN
eukprot:CAMPEP_0194298802 /NCGR_PEP_ID=MMETSP0169-20130528/60367_1 /TAXON_ID=218684 /ORGANISM="Corethron pennatum, Strain L29A3" /LENGTH=609 /DNA_ID=CAMNT_0039048829 /DNA_START=55 /DNA_END=1884 /DNA_ORIENTATION=+